MPNVGKDAEQLDFSYTGCENENSQFGKHFGSFLQNYTCIYHNPSN